MIDFHCEKHAKFQPVCGGCQKVKAAYWQARSAPVDPEDIPFEPLPEPTPRPALTRQTDPDTSKEAAAEMSEERMSNLHNKIVEALRALGVATRRMIWEWCGEEQGTITPRFRHLLDHGIIVVSHKGRCPVTKRPVEWLRLA